MLLAASTAVNGFDMQLVNIEVTPDIAEKIRFMAESGVFAIKTGNASLNFLNGGLKSIKTEITSYAQVAVNEIGPILSVSA